MFSHICYFLYIFMMMCQVSSQEIAETFYRTLHENPMVCDSFRVLNFLNFYVFRNYKFVAFVFDLIFVVLVCVFSRVRIIGSSTLALCHIATGAAEAYYQYGLHCWDIAAAAVIIREAGGCVIDTSGDTWVECLQQVRAGFCKAYSYTPLLSIRVSDFVRCMVKS